MARHLVAVFLLCYVLWHRTNGIYARYPDDYQLVIMEENCNLTTPLNLSIAALLNYTKSTYKPTPGCHYIIEAPEGRRISLAMAFIDIRKTPQCQSDRLLIYDGKYPNTSRINNTIPQYGLCGKQNLFKSEKHHYISKGRHLTLDFKADGPTHPTQGYTGFQFAATAVRDPPCNTGEFRCDNFVCIKKSLKVDLVNNCGDWSDEKELIPIIHRLWFTLLMALICVMALAVSIICIAVCCCAGATTCVAALCACCCKRKSAKVRQDSNRQAVVTAPHIPMDKTALYESPPPYSVEYTEKTAPLPVTKY